MRAFAIGTLAALGLAACSGSELAPGRCVTAADCAPTAVCVDRSCVPSDGRFQLDAGRLPDAAPRDAQPILDASARPDARTDAGPTDPDATPAGDAGDVPDAQAPSDALPGDAVAPDATALDASPARDAAIPDAGPARDAGPVGIGVYDFRRVILPGLASTRELGPMSIAPDGLRMVLAEREDRLRLVALPGETSTITAALPKDTNEPIRIQAVTHLPSSAVLILATAYTGSASARTPQGRVYRAALDLGGLVELRGLRRSGASFESLAWNPRTGELTVAEQRTAGAGYVMTLSTWDDTLRTLVQPRAESTSAGIQGLAWAEDGLGGMGRVFVGGNNGSTIGHVDSTGALVLGSGAGNTSRVSARPQGDYALAVAWSSSRLLRFDRGVWTVSTSPNLGNSSAFDLAFSDDGARALVAGGYSSGPDVFFLAEFRHDLYTAADIVEVSIPSFSLAPWQGVSGVQVGDIVWRPGCDGGYVSGGCNTFSCTRGYLIAFRVLNGRVCP